MSLTNRETWTLIHGLILGSLFLLAFAGGLAGFWSLMSGTVVVMAFNAFALLFA